MTERKSTGTNASLILGLARSEKIVQPGPRKLLCHIHTILNILNVCPIGLPSVRCVTWNIILFLCVPTRTVYTPAVSDAARIAVKYIVCNGIV